VHSSTLVTAGLYLILRFYDIYIINFYIYKFLLLASIFTSFYAGLNTFVEFDIKKLVALSTLSHIGFIGIRYCIGLHTIIFFHLLTHAIFKSVLFISLGNIIYLSHSQDIRYLSIGLYSTPSSSFIALLCCFNLLGIPSLSGFFSKDLVLEFINFSNCRFFILFIIYINVFFTY